MVRQTIKYILAIVLIAGLTGTVLAQEGAEKGNGKVASSSVMKEVQGEITWIGKKDIAVVYNRDLAAGVEDEILLPIDKDIRLQHKQKLSELAVGDTIAIQYAEDTEDDGQGNIKVKRHARLISFVKPAIKKPDTGTTTESTDDTLNDTLSIKGVKGD